LDLQARLVVEGFISGLHRSPFHGFSVEFATHRKYVPGDDIRHIDWKVLARTDRYYVKQYEEETNLRATFVVDASESMHYAGESSGRRGEGREGLSKYHYAATVAASLALLLLKQQDAVGLAVFDEELRSHLPASASPNQIKPFVHALDVVEPTAKTSVEEICHSLAERLARRGLICLISHEVMVLHVMDQDELSFPFQGNTRFVGLEDAGRLTVNPRALREGYLEAVETFCRNVKRRCIAAKMDYKLISTADHLDAALLAFLAARAAAARKAGAKR